MSKIGSTLAALIRSEYKKWGDVVKRSGAKVD